MNPRILAPCALFAFAPSARAQTAPTEAATPSPSVTPEPPETVIEVTTTRNPRPLSQSTSAVTVVTRAQIEAKKAVDASDLVRLAPGVTVSQNGGRGQLSSVFVRGAAPRQSLVLIDGVRANAQSFGGFDFSSIPAETVERIEVLRGPQAGIYGADALGGVINIITRRGSGPLRTGGAFELGTQGQNRQLLTVRGDAGRGNVSFSLSRFGTKNFRRNEDFRDFDASLRYDTPLSRGFGLALISRLDRNNVGVPGSRFFPDPNETNRLRQNFNAIELSRRATRRRDTLRLGYLRRSLRDDNPVNVGDEFPFSSQTQSRDRVLTLEAQSALTLGRNTLTLGGELRREAARFDGGATSRYDKGTSTRSLFALYEARAGKFALTPSVRYEDNSKFGGHTGGRLAGSYNVDTRTKLKASVGNGFRVPTLDQLFYPGFSNPNLHLEKSSGFDLGVERQLAGGRLEVTLFRNRFRDLIDFPPPDFVPLNVSRARTQGVEIGFDKTLGRGFRTIINQTFLRTKSASSGYLVRRPKFATSADLLYRRGKYDFDLGFIAQGRRKDVGATGVAGFGGYTRFDFSVGYDLQPGLQLYARVGNVLNRRYEEVAGYRSPRFNVVFGVQNRAF